MKKNQTHSHYKERATKGHRKRNKTIKIRTDITCPQPLVPTRGNCVKINCTVNLFQDMEYVLMSNHESTYGRKHH